MFFCFVYRSVHFGGITSRTHRVLYLWWIAMIEIELLKQGMSCIGCWMRYLSNELNHYVYCSLHLCSKEGCSSQFLNLLHHLAPVFCDVTYLGYSLNCLLAVLSLGYCLWIACLLITMSLSASVWSSVLSAPCWTLNTAWNQIVLVLENFSYLMHMFYLTSYMLLAPMITVILL